MPQPNSPSIAISQGAKASPSPTPLLYSDLAGLPRPRRGKVRDVYDLGDHVLLVATDRISAFDLVMANGIPDKGRVLNQVSAFWFEFLSDVCPNHVISSDDRQIAKAVGAAIPELAGRATLAAKARTLPVECVARAYISGSLLKEYRRRGGNVHELGLPDGLEESAKLPEPIFTPATKAEQGHDENISFREACNVIGRENAETVREWTLRLFGLASAKAAQAGLILADTKFEFGETPDGRLIWIDEALTPDSSRYWEASDYRPGRSQPSYDKQFVRDYLESIGWNKQPPGPELPPDVVEKTRQKYLEAFRRITGRDLV
ncbi:MAG TPA: phosphoribosylaminoimidazolesuccinocarboxamide synthase [Fimbriimonas sp.]|nr:phosphoribosylaminoimidazolesuccinocarboxamide synthase [Fimbriimonas sp.]